MKDINNNEIFGRIDKIARATMAPAVYDDFAKNRMSTVGDKCPPLSHLVTLMRLIAHEYYTHSKIYCDSVAKGAPQFYADPITRNEYEKMPKRFHQLFDVQPYFDTYAYYKPFSKYGTRVYFVHKRYYHLFNKQVEQLMSNLDDLTRYNQNTLGDSPDALVLISETERLLKWIGMFATIIPGTDKMSNVRDEYVQMKQRKNIVLRQQNKYQPSISVARGEIKRYMDEISRQRQLMLDSTRASFEKTRMY